MLQARQNVIGTLILMSAVVWAPAEITVRNDDAPPAKPVPAATPTASVPVATPLSIVAAPPTPGADTLEFINNDKLHGNLLSVAAAGTKPSGTLSWKHAAADKTIDFDLQGLARATLAPRKFNQPPAPAASIYLTNGDMLPGSIVSMDGEKLVVDTWYAGRITVNRLMMKSMNPNSGVSSTVYEGPTGLSDWTTYRGGAAAQWKFKNGALYAMQSYPIGREVEGLPDVGEIRFEAAWRNSYPQFYFTFCADNPQDMGSGYMLQFSGSSIYLQRYSRDSGSRNLAGGNSNYEAFNEGKLRSARFTMLYDKSKKTFALLINGVFVTQWSDTMSFSGKGNCISFRSNNNGDLKISNIRIAQWDGKLPEATGTASDAVIKEDLVRFVNNDKVSGQIKSIAGGTLKLETSYATLDIPLARVAEIVSSTEKAERARKNKEDIRATFAEKGVLTLQLNRLEKDELKGKSENFGEITLPLCTLSQIDFNIYQERQVETDEDAF